MTIDRDEMLPVDHKSRDPYYLEAYMPAGLDENFLEKLDKLEKFEALHEKGRAPKLKPKEKSDLLQAMHNAKYIYFVLSEDSGLVKIGKTKSIKQRFSSLQTMSPVPLRLIGCFRAHDALERILHERFERYRCHGEWFKLNDEMIGLIETGSEYGVRALIMECAKWMKKARPEMFY